MMNIMGISRLISLILFGRRWRALSYYCRYDALRILRRNAISSRVCVVKQRIKISVYSCFRIQSKHGEFYYFSQTPSHLIVEFTIKYSSSVSLWFKNEWTGPSNAMFSYFCPCRITELVLHSDHQDHNFGLYFVVTGDLVMALTMSSATQGWSTGTCKQIVQNINEGSYKRF